MRPVSDVRRAQALVEAGWPVQAAARMLGLPRSTVRDWARRGFEETLNGPGRRPEVDGCTAQTRAEAQPATYAYLFGQYLGDGTIDWCQGRIHKLRIFCSSRYPGIIGRTVATTRALVPGRVSAAKVRDVGLVIVTTYWNHLPCLFPQHGPGRKHERLIVLDDWQDDIVLAHPKPFLRGLIESDGCRSINRVNGGEYPRYSFSNRSEDIRALFVRSVEQLGLRWTTANRWTVAVSRRPDVAVLDDFIGPKW